MMQALELCPSACCANRVRLWRAVSKSFRPCGVVAQPEQIRVIRCDGHEVVFPGGDARLLRELSVRAEPAVKFRVTVGKRDGSAAAGHAKFHRWLSPDT